MPIYNNRNFDDAIKDIMDDEVPENIRNLARSVGLLYNEKYTRSINSFSRDLQEFYRDNYPNQRLEDNLGRLKALANFSETGTCFLYDKDKILTAGHVLTASHDLQEINIEDFRVVFGAWVNGSRLEKTREYDIKKILYYGDRDYDIALLKLSDSVPERTLRIEPNSEIAAGTNVCILGFPLSLPQKFAKGTVCVNDPGLNSMSTKIDAFIGNSGSPVINEDEKVVGIYTGSSDDFIKPIVGNYDVIKNGPGYDTVYRIPDTM